MKKGAFSRGGLPKVFMDRFGQHVTGFTSGFDRLRFRATLRPMFQPGGLEIYLYSCKVLLKDFAKLAKELTNQIRKAAYSHFEQLKLPIRYVADSSLSKEDLARELASGSTIAQQLDRAGGWLLRVSPPVVSANHRPDARLALLLERFSE